MPTLDQIPPQLLIYAALIMGIVVILRTIQKPFSLVRPSGLTLEQSSEFLRREVGVAMTSYHANYFAPAINSFIETQKTQTEILLGLQRDQAEITKILAVLADRIPR